MRLFLVLLTALSFQASAEVYKWTDADGNVHFGSQPPPGKREQVEIRESAPGDMGARDSISSQKSGPNRQSEQVRLKNAMAESRARANQRACDLSRTELESAQRLLTLAQSQYSSDFVLERREKRVAHWKERVELHCKSS